MRPVLTSARANAWRAASAHDGAAQRVLGRRARREEARGAARDLRGSAPRPGGARRRSCRAASSPAWPCSTSASFQPRLAASWMPVLPPRAPNGLDDVRRVADEEHAAVRGSVSSRWSRYWYGPIQTNSNSTSGPSCSRSRAPATSGRLMCVRVAVLGHLVVDAPDVVGHQVLPDGAAFVEGRVDPGPALGRQRLLEAHVADAPAVGAARGVGLEAELRADRGCWRRWRRSS